MVEGSCYCGARIGGNNHNLLANNAELQQRAFEEKGYNLPPSSVRSTVDTERNLQPLLLNLLRWMLNAALITSPAINLGTVKSRLLKINDGTDVHDFLKGHLMKDFEGKQTVIRNTSVKHVTKIHCNITAYCGHVMLTRLCTRGYVHAVISKTHSYVIGLESCGCSYCFIGHALLLYYTLSYRN